MASSLPTSAEIRANAARAITRITKQNRTIDWLQNNHPNWFATPLANELIFGTSRHYHILDRALAEYLKKPLRDKDADIKSLLLVGAYQLEYLDIPAHAVIHETVSAVKVLRRPWAKGLVNAILRAFNRGYDAEKNIDQTFGYPCWYVSLLRDSYPTVWPDLIAANFERAPMSLRINTQKISPQAYRECLRNQQIDFATAWLPESVVLKAAQPSEQLPGWREGHVAVQDLGAQFAAELLLAAKPLQNKSTGGSHFTPSRVLDACAAPGGKLAHLLERLSAPASAAPGIEPTVQALDISRQRIQSSERILARLGHHAAFMEGDAHNLDWWDRQPYSHILLDAPCTGTGTIRRHPDIALLLNEQAVSDQAATQTLLLNNLWQTLAPGGNLLYCTCSVLAAENDHVIREFLDTHADASAQSINLPSGHATTYGWQLLPTEPLTDGFYYALLHKVPLVGEH